MVNFNTVTTHGGPRSSLGLYSLLINICLIVLAVVLEHTLILGIMNYPVYEKNTANLLTMISLHIHHTSDLYTYGSPHIADQIHF